MNEYRHDQNSSIVVECDQPLIGLILEEDGREIIHYFTDETQADAALMDTDIQEALGTIGAFADLDWEEMRDGLEQIRHESPPTPSIEL